MKLIKPHISVSVFGLLLPAVLKVDITVVSPTLNIQRLSTVKVVLRVVPDISKQSVCVQDSNLSSLHLVGLGTERKDLIHRGDVLDHAGGNVGGVVSLESPETVGSGDSSSDVERREFYYFCQFLTVVEQREKEKSLPKEATLIKTNFLAPIL